MLTPEMEAAFNRQFNEEQTASHQYLGMAVYFEENDLKGFAAFMRRQSDEERQHALKVFDFILARGGTVKLGPIPAANSSFKSVKTVFEAAYAREQANTKSIHELYALSLEQNDYASQPLLHWFISEQVEEEEWCMEAIGLLERAGDDVASLLQLDVRYATEGMNEGGEGEE